MKHLTFLLFLPIVVAAETHRAESFADALSRAKETGTPFAVYIHGSSWHPASRIFAAEVWGSSGLEAKLRNRVILTDIHVPQSPDEETAKSKSAKDLPWDSKTVPSYPAIQVYAPDGFLLKTSEGGDFRNLKTAADVAAFIDEITSASAPRSSLLAELSLAREAGDRAAETAALVALWKLPVNSDPKLVDQLKTADPEDSSGLQTRLTFGDWWFVREVNGLVSKGETAEALSRVDRMLASPVYTPEQRVFLHGARGSVLVAQDRLDEAWQEFRKAHESSPHDPNASAMLEYGRRVAGIPSRRVFPEDSVLAGQDIGELLTADSRFTMSSAAYDVPANHASLFRGPFRDFAFHTNNEKGAHIVIDLGGDCRLKAFRIANRNSNADRARSLTVWYSLDGTTWTPTWASGEVESTWEVLLPSPVRTRYIKVGLSPELSNFLHLRAFDGFGERL